MPDPAVVVDLVLGTTDLFGEDANDCRLAFWFVGGFNNVPATRGVDVVVPHRAGRVRGPRKADVLSVPIAGWLLAPDGLADEDARAAFRTSMTTLQALFAAASTVEATLEATLEDGSVATLAVLVKPPVLVREHPAGMAAELDIDLESIAPSWTITPPGS